MIHDCDYEREGVQYWNPFSIVLSAAVIILLVVFSVAFLFKGSADSALQAERTPGNNSEIAGLEAREKALATKEELMAEREAALNELAGIRAAIIDELTQRLSSLKLPLEIDKVNGNIRFTETVLFGKNNDALNAEGKQYLNTFMPVYLSVLLNSDHVKYLDQIIIEGHADIDGGYWFNLNLSQDRANSVANYIREQQLAQLPDGASAIPYLAVSARSHNAPVSVDGVVDRSRSRRVEFVFRLKDDELLQKLEDITRGEG